jgi:hypothetical protein
MYETFAGVSPLGDACGTAALYAHVNLIPTPISEIVKTVPNIIDGVVLKALEKWEHDRYHSADELLAALELIQRTDGQPIIESEQPLWWRLVKKVCP